MTTPDREWVSFDDPEEEGRRWMIDVTFLTSHWRCLFGCGCQGVLTEPTPEMVQGCCSYGAWFVDDDDRVSIEKIATTLPDDVWQFAAIGRQRGIAAKVGNAYRTRLVDDACIMLNRPDFAGGPGCALHAYALRTGQRPMDLKPLVCWQLPLKRIEEENDDGTITSTLTEFSRDGWGPGGDDFAWWCTEAPEAFTDGDPVYKTMEPELRETLGDHLYELVARYLDERAAGKPAFARHPAEIPVAFVTKRR